MKQSEADLELVKKLWLEHRNATEVGKRCGLPANSVGQIIARMRSEGMELPLSLAQEQAAARTAAYRAKYEELAKRDRAGVEKNVRDPFRKMIEDAARALKKPDAAAEARRALAQEMPGLLYEYEPAPKRLYPAASLVFRLVDRCRALPDAGLTPQTAALRELAEVIHLMIEADIKAAPFRNEAEPSGG